MVCGEYSVILHLVHILVYFWYMPVVLSAIVPIFLLIALGICIRVVLDFKCTHVPLLARRCKMHNDAWSAVLNKYVLYIALPALLFFSLEHTRVDQLLAPSLLFFNVLLLVAIIGFGVLLTRVLKYKAPMANAYIFCLFFGNVAYIGLPFILSVMPGAAGELSVLVAIHAIVAFTLGLFILEKSIHKHAQPMVLLYRVVKNPLLIAIFVGLMFLLFGWQLPAAIDTAVQMLAQSASPVVLIAIGLFIARKIEIDNAFWHGAVLAGFKLFIMPLAFFLVAILFGVREEFTTSILEAAMPVAITTFALGELYPMHKKVVIDAIIISTIGSLFSLTLWGALLL